MIYILLFITGAILGTAISAYISQRKTAGLIAENTNLTATISAKTQEVDMLSARIKEQEDTYRRQVQEQKEADTRHMEDMSRRYENRISELKQMHSAQIEDITKRHEREQREGKELLDRQLNERLQLVQEQLKVTTEQLLKQRSEELNTNNRTQMSSIIEPLKAVMNEMKKSMDDSRDTFNRSTASLGEQLKQMHETTANLGIEAEKLSKALRTGPKIQGDFGEMKLNDLLDKFGFTKGIEYDVQYTMRDKKGNVIHNDDTNNMMRPDVVLHYPDKKDVIIDSKASLTSFINYVNAETDEERTISLDEHVRSIRRHVDELAAKNYGKYSMEGGTTLDFVIMFVPHEAAMQLALSADNDLWGYAFNRNVLITGEQNLFALLRLLQMSWTQQRQADNQEQVFSLADTLIDRVGLFIERFDRLEHNINIVNKSFDDAKKTLRGNQSFIVSAKKLVEMGAKENVRRRLPDIEEEDNLSPAPSQEKGE